MKLILIKKSSLLRDGMFELLKRQFPKFDIVCCDAEDGGALRRTGESIDLAILDMDISSDIEEWLIYFQSMSKKVILWVENVEDSRLKSLFNLALDGYLCSEMNERELAQAVDWVLEGRRFIHPALSQCLLDIHVQMQSKNANPPYQILSKREWEVLQLLVKGYSNLKIAEELFISDKTVKNYVSSILHKLEVPDRTNAVLTALKNNWLCL